MATLAECWTASQTAGFQQRVMMAVLQTAKQYTEETAGTPLLNKKRRELAVTIMNNPTPWMIPFAYTIAAQQVLVADPDETIQTMVYEIWDNMAGVYSEDYPQEGA